MSGSTGNAPTTIDDLVRAVARTETSASVTPGQVLDGTYELVERLGGGGMGIVFRAHDLRLGRDVAVKVLRRSHSTRDVELRKMFEREARATAQLLHPNIVTLHHVGEHEGHPYLVLELLAGETLASRLARRGRLTEQEALAVLDPVLAALAFAHEHGVLHRDLKPNNVFITVDERIKVLDFGLALSLDTDPGPSTRAAGTPGYMAPEQRDGLAQDQRTDLWAAARLLVECVAGRRDDDEPETTRAIDELSLPASARAQLQRALSADPADRPETVNVLRNALASTRARGASAAPRPRWQRSARTFAFALVAAGAGAAIHAAVRDDDSAPRPLSPSEVSGMWEVNFGMLLVEVDDDGNAYGVYEHDRGIMVGLYQDGLFMGRWCELPSRLPEHDAGNIQLHFASGGKGLRVDGRWTYGDATSARWNAGKAGFYGVKRDLPARADLAERLARRELCP